LVVEVRVTKQTTIHLIERAAQRLRESGATGAAELMRDVADPIPLFPAMPEDSTTIQSAAGPGGRPAAEEHAVAGEHAAPAPAVPVAESETLVRTVTADAMRKAGMINWSAKRGRIAEEFRIVQGQIMQAIAADGRTGRFFPNLIMITSARPGEGKSFTSLNLAGSLACYGGRPVVLVDVDAKPDSLSARLGLAQAPGLLDLAADQVRRIDDTIFGTELANLSIMPIGGREGARVTLSARMPIVNAVERLARRFADSIVVLDAPPCLASSDPSTLAPMVGQIVMLVEAQRTQRAEVEAALDLVDSCPAVMMLLNKVQLTGSNTFGAYG
jgi:protein-tyrosine kinase